MSPVVVKEKGKAEKRKKDEKEKTNSETETVTPPAKQVSIYFSVCLIARTQQTSKTAEPIWLKVVSHMTSGKIYGSTKLNKFRLEKK